MTLINKISSVLPLLDSKKDAFLIALLEEKIKYTKYNNEQNILDIHSITDKQYGHAKVGVERLMVRLLEESCELAPYKKEYNEKINSIIRDCEGCPRSKIKANEWYGCTTAYNRMNKKDKVCVSCQRRCDMLDGSRYSNYEEIEYVKNNMDKEFMNKIIKLKAIIQKIKRKI